MTAAYGFRVWCGRRRFGLFVFNPVGKAIGFVAAPVRQ